MRVWSCVIAILIFYPKISLAGLYPVPISIKYGYDLNLQNNFEVVWGMQEIPGLDVPVPEQYDVIVLAVRAVSFHAGGSSLITGGGFSSGGKVGEFWSISSIRPGETLASAAERFGPGLPSKIDTRNYFQSSIADGCIGVVFMKKYNENWGSVFSPPGTCVVLPPLEESTVSCNIVTPSIVFDHGEIGVGKAVFSSATRELDIECSGTMSASIAFDSSNLNLGSMRTTLSVPDANYGVVELKQGSNTLSVLSLLTGNALEIGKFSASTVMKVTFL
ncbi:hypothetical protein [Serratia bockelmannii]|uniref:hypothetical protein n=1 Tax=Serratia bockelmannii TaxID=2703793 RepID=UPI00235ED757|nr:hypothetical protein [Serratia bockelmannii]